MDVAHEPPVNTGDVTIDIPLMLPPANDEPAATHISHMGLEVKRADTVELSSAVKAAIPTSSSKTSRGVLGAPLLGRGQEADDQANSAPKKPTQQLDVTPFARSLSLLAQGSAGAVHGQHVNKKASTTDPANPAVQLALAASPLTSLTVFVLNQDAGAPAASNSSPDGPDEDKAAAAAAEAGRAEQGPQPWLVKVYMAVQQCTQRQWKWSPQLSAKAGLGAAYLWQIAGLVGMALFVVYGGFSDGLCQVQTSTISLRHASNWAKGSWFTGLLLAGGRRLFLGSNADGTKALVDALDSYSSGLSVLATLQLGDLLWASQHDGVEEVCTYVQRAELLALGWAAVYLLGWYSAWDTVLKRAEGREQDITVLSMLNPVGQVHQLIVTLLTKRYTRIDYGSDFWNFQVRGGMFSPRDVYNERGSYDMSHCNIVLFHCWQTLSLANHKLLAKRIAAVLVVCAAVVLSFFAGWGGLGGLRSAVVLAGLAGLSNAIAVDRLLWLGWCVTMLTAYSKHITTALAADGFSDASDAAEILVLLFFIAGRSWDAEHCLLQQSSWLPYTEPLGLLVAKMQMLTLTKIAQVEQAPLLDALRRKDFTAAVDILAVSETVDENVLEWIIAHAEPPMLDFLKKCIDVGALTATQLQPVLPKAIRAGWLAMVQWMAQHVDIAHFVDGDQTPVHLAACRGHLEMVQWLVNETKTDANAQDIHGMTPVHWAARTGHLEMVQWLVNTAEADANTQDNNGQTPVHAAASSGHLDVVQWLILEAEADANAQDGSGQTPVHLAARVGYLEMMEWLINDAKADANAQDNSGQTPVHVAAGGVLCLEVVQWLIDEAKADANAQDNYGQTVAHKAAMVDPDDDDDVFALLQWLIEHTTVDANVQDGNGQTAAHLAAMNGNIDILMCLSEFASKSVLVLDRAGCTILHYAAQAGHLDIVQWIVQDSDVDAGATDLSDRTAAQLATLAGHDEVVQWLALEANAEVPATDDQKGPDVMVGSVHGVGMVVKSGVAFVGPDDSTGGRYTVANGPQRSTLVARGVRVEQDVFHYQVELLTDGVMWFGWSTPALSSSDEWGVGYGWAFAGCFPSKWHNKESIEYGRRKWRTGDVVGCSLDLSKREVRFSLNDADLGVAFELTEEDVNDGLYATVILNEYQRVRLLFSKEDLIQPLPTGCRPLLLQDTTQDSIATDDNA